MNFLQALKLGTRNLQRRRLRVLLTLLGIFIGIAAVVSLVSVSEGLKVAITEEFEKIGSDKLFISPETASSSQIGGVTTLTDDDVDAIERVNGVKVAAGQVFEAANIEFRDEFKTGFVSSYPDEQDKQKLVQETNLLEIEEGRFVKKGDNLKVVIGNAFANQDVFERRMSLGDKVTIKEQDFKIIGILKAATPDVDRTFYVNDDFMRDLFDRQDEHDFISVQIQKGEEPIEIADVIERALRRERGLDKGDEDFVIQTPESILETLGTILNIVQAVLIGIAGISLVVGGIGIMNTMYTSVLERTQEIGIMKAIGAKNKDILLIFIIESGLLGLGGGILGIIIGAGIAKLIEIVAAQTLGTSLLVAVFPNYLIFGSLAFSFIVGIMSGILPARQASKLKVVDALRYAK